MNTMSEWASATTVAADWLLVIMVTLAILGNVAVLRSRKREGFLREAIRRMAIAGSTLLCIRWWLLLLTNEGLNIHVVAVMGLTLVFTSIFFNSMYSLFQDDLDSYFHNKNLFGSQRHDS